MNQIKKENKNGEEKGVFFVKVETIAWINTFVEGAETGSCVFRESASEGDTVEDVLHRLCERFPKLSAALWEGRELGPHIEIIVNNTILGVEYDLESPVKADDEIILAGQFVGG